MNYILVTCFGLLYAWRGIEAARFFQRPRSRPSRQSIETNSISDDYMDYYDDMEESVPGMPGVDYPMLSSIPTTSFQCNNNAPGYYADPEAQCQLFHVCFFDGRHDSFLCPNGTIFNQKYFVCDWWYNSDCTEASNYYFLNNNLFLGEQSVYEGTDVLNEDGFGSVIRPRPSQSQRRPNPPKRPEPIQRRPPAKKRPKPRPPKRPSSRTQGGNLGPILNSIVGSPLPSTYRTDSPPIMLPSRPPSPPPTFFPPQSHQPSPMPFTPTTYHPDDTPVTGSIQASRIEDDYGEYDPFYEAFLDEYYDDSEYDDDEYDYDYGDLFSELENGDTQSNNYDYSAQMVHANLPSTPPSSSSSFAYSSSGMNDLTQEGGYATTPPPMPMKGHLGKSRGKDSYYDEWLDEYYDDSDVMGNPEIYSYFDDMLNENLDTEKRYKRFLALMKRLKRQEEQRVKKQKFQQKRFTNDAKKMHKKPHQEKKKMHNRKGKPTKNNQQKFFSHVQHNNKQNFFPNVQQQSQVQPKPPHKPNIRRPHRTTKWSKPVKKKPSKKKLVPLVKRIQRHFKNFNPRDFKFWAKLQKEVMAKRKG